MQQQWHRHQAEVRKRIAETSTEIPAHRAAFRKGFAISPRPLEDQLALWDQIWQHGNWYERLHAFFFLEHYTQKAGADTLLWQTACQWQQQIDDWALCDNLAKIYTKLLEAMPEVVYPTLAGWNKSNNLWMRRQSVVSLLYFSRTKNVFLPFHDIAALLLPLLGDPEYYVQKGAGWTLRELGNVYPAETLALLQAHVTALSAIAFTIAIEKLDGQEKFALKMARKKSRI